MSTAAIPIAQTYNETYARFADRLAVRDEHAELTYAQLGQQARRFANAVRGLGVPHDARVVMVGPNSCEWLAADQGLALAGYTRAGILPRLHPVEVAQIAEDIEPSLVIVDAQWLANAGSAWIPSGVSEIVILGAGGTPQSHPVFADVIASANDDELPLPSPDSIAWVMYTSGSTGLPKGVLGTQISVGAMLRNGFHEIAYRSEDVAFHTAPISHFSGSIMMTVAAAGGLNILRKSFEVDDVIAAAEGGQVTVLPLVPTMITLLVEEMTRRGSPQGGVGAVRMLIYAGSAIQPDRAAKAAQYFGQVMTQVYGLSESPLPITVLRPEDHIDVAVAGGLPRLASAGRPAEFVGVTIIDERDQELPTGEVGEIRVSGEQVSSGYWRQPEATAEVFAGQSVKSGDLGYIDEEGFLFILDRRKDMIITGGFNVYPREVENAISTMPGVREVAVIGAPDDRWGESITAVIALEPAAAIDQDQVIAFCRTKLGGFKVPKRVTFVEELPKSGVGKILKAQIKAELWAGRARKV
jgi:acyl-CoA synthetase (AMP-forming)/AMP-acid ligase II